MSWRHCERAEALAFGIEGLVDELDHGPAEHSDRVMAVQHLARSIAEEANAALETLEMAEMAAERAKREPWR